MSMRMSRVVLQNCKQLKKNKKKNKIKNKKNKKKKQTIFSFILSLLTLFVREKQSTIIMEKQMNQGLLFCHWFLILSLISVLLLLYMISNKWYKELLIFADEQRKHIKCGHNKATIIMERQPEYRLLFCHSFLRFVTHFCVCLQMESYNSTWCIFTIY